MRNSATARLRIETDYFRKSNNQLVNRERRIRSVQVKGFHVIGVLLLVLAMALIARQAAAFLFRWEKLSIREIQVSQPPKAEAEKLEAVLAKIRGNILAIDLKELEKRLLDLPEVKAVAISRILPSTVRLDFSLRQPQFQHAVNGKWQTLDAEGHPIRWTDSADPRLVSILFTLPGELNHVLAQGEGLQRLAGAIEYVAYRQPYGLEVRLRDIREIIYPGEASPVGRIEEYVQFRRRLGVEAEYVAYADLRFEGRIYLGMKPKEEAVNEK